MNFKPNLWKNITSFIIGIVGGYFYYDSKYGFGIYNNPLWVVIGFIVAFLVVYLIWSLIQKK